jgi:hypothetical protein
MEHDGTDFFPQPKFLPSYPCHALLAIILAVSDHSLAAVPTGDLPENEHHGKASNFA